MYMKNESNIQNEYSAPKYPTLAQVNAYSKKHALTKAAAVTAIIASVSLCAACGETAGKYKGDNIGEKISSASEDIDSMYQVVGEIELMGEDTVCTEPTEWQIDGDVPDTTEDVALGGITETVATTDEADWMIQGEEEAPCET